MSSLEVNWVRNVDKSMPTPVVVFAPLGGSCSGYVSWPSRSEELVEDGLYYPRDRGLIVVATDAPEMDTGSTIAHEWRHLWQYWHGWTYDGHGWDQGYDYEESICRYFKQSWSEADALKFEVQHSPPNIYHDYWLSLLTNALEWY